MARRYLSSSVALLVVVVALVTGPVVGVDVTSDPPSAFGDGTATVDEVAVETETLRVTGGRFGTGVEYVRVPTATVTVATVTDRPRLVYVVAVPGLDIELTDSVVVTDAGTYRLDPGDRGLESGSATATQYEGRVAVRVQSFTDAKTVYRENATVEVAT
ncbi:hypothetical protein [Haloarcula marina]|uniref:hypothetical protein n=1 Tax=Haloarcula marina TaxID=2961574 RepID=UPI0020B66D0F|nr:hypothetical protein [Halomicroarcula marina]